MIKYIKWKILRVNISDIYLSKALSFILLFRRLQNILTNHEESIRKLTIKLSSTQELDSKVKKFFGENEDFHKKKAQELTKQNQDLSKKLEESEKSR